MVYKRYPEQSQGTQSLEATLLSHPVLNKPGYSASLSAMSLSDASQITATTMSIRQLTIHVPNGDRAWQEAK